MAVEVSHRAERIEERLAAITCPADEQVSQTAYRVVGPRRDAAGLSRRPSSEQSASVRNGNRNLIRDDESLLELSGDTDKAVDGLLHILDFRQEVLRVTQLEAELATAICHRHRERVRADDASRTVHAVQVGALIHTIEDAEAVLEHAISDLELVEVSAKAHRDKTTATVEDSASGLDHGTRTANGVLDDLPKPGIAHGDVSVRQSLADLQAVIAAAEVVLAFDRGDAILVEEATLLQLVGESVLETNFLHDLSEAVPSHLDSGLNVAHVDISRHFLLSFLVSC